MQLLPRLPLPIQGSLPACLMQLLPRLPLPIQGSLPAYLTITRDSGLPLLVQYKVACPFKIYHLRTNWCCTKIYTYHYFFLIYSISINKIVLSMKAQAWSGSRSSLGFYPKNQSKIITTWVITLVCSSSSDGLQDRSLHSWLNWSYH